MTVEEKTKDVKIVLARSIISSKLSDIVEVCQYLCINPCEQCPLDKSECDAIKSLDNMWTRSK